ncbi:MAG: riboflavin synthase [Vicinamibacterales bacterium]
MFTGLIEAVGRVVAVEPGASGVSLRVSAPFAGECHDGESVAVSGVCLTVTTRTHDELRFDVAPETLRVTTLGGLAPGRRVNLERAMRADDRFGGHIVQGHVDGVGRVAGLRPSADTAWLEVDVPDALAATMIPKGSVTIDGVSLTIAALAGPRIGVQLVPFTLAHTTFGDAGAGDAVNIETDVIGKYVARLLAGQHAAPGVGPA